METDNPDSQRGTPTDPSEIGSLRVRAMGIIAFATVLALLYVGRNVLIPLTIALMLSLAIAPLVRKLRRVGLGQTVSVLVAVLAAAILITAAAVVLGTQLLRMAASLLAVPPGSVLLCLGLGSPADTIAAELLVRALRDQGLDARHVSLEDVNAGSRPPGADPAAVAIAYLVSAFPGPEREQIEQTVDRVRPNLPSARVGSVFLPGVSVQPEFSPRVENADYAVNSFVKAVQASLARQRPEIA